MLLSSWHLTLSFMIFYDTHNSKDAEIFASGIVNVTHNTQLRASIIDDDFMNREQAFCCNSRLPLSAAV